jgi:hypothetical protein
LPEKVVTVSPYWLNISLSAYKVSNLSQSTLVETVHAPEANEVHMMVAHHQGLTVVYESQYPSQLSSLPKSSSN